MLTLPPLSLYIHYPWCVKKCPYCDFNSHEGGDDQHYVETLLADLDVELDFVQNRELVSIFIGGGTPSLLSAKALSQLLAGIGERLDFSKDIEISLESNPGTFELEKFNDFKAAGINRLSIGVQSFFDQHLQALGRIHSAEEALNACTQASLIFDNINIDLMYGLSAQTAEQCLSDVEQALALSPQHLSFYQLSIEPNTYFAKYPPSLPEVDSIWQMGEQAMERLQTAGLERYEVSAYGRASKHNLNYWQFGDYLGIGAGAHGKITQVENNRIIRTLKPKSPKDYLAAPVAKTVDINNRVFDFMLNALRLRHGFTPELFTQTTGISLDEIQPTLARAQNLALLEVSETCIKPSAKGYNFLNDLQEMFL